MIKSRPTLDFSKLVGSTYHQQTNLLSQIVAQKILTFTTCCPKMERVHDRRDAVRETAL